MINFAQQINNLKDKFEGKGFQISLIILAIFVFIYYLFHFPIAKPNFTEIKINNNTIYSQIADSENERSLGLSFTKKLEENAGMLFIFENISQKNFWMRDMNYNLDILWIDESKTITGFVENADKDSYNSRRPNDSRIYRSPENTKYVLELPAGTIAKLKIKSGDIISFKY